MLPLERLDQACFVFSDELKQTADRAIAYSIAQIIQPRYFHSTTALIKYNKTRAYSSGVSHTPE